MYTGYFAKLKYYEEQGLIPIAICGGIPKWYNGLWFEACPWLKTKGIPTASRL